MSKEEMENEKEEGQKELQDIEAEERKKHWEDRAARERKIKAWWFDMMSNNYGIYTAKTFDELFLTVWKHIRMNLQDFQEETPENMYGYLGELLHKEWLETYRLDIRKEYKEELATEAARKRMARNQKSKEKKQ